MGLFELKLPKMGESVDEATLTSWLVDIGDFIEMDDGVLEVSTDKVDTEIPSEVSGVLIEKRFEVDTLIKVGETLAIIEFEGEDGTTERQEPKEQQVATKDLKPVPTAESTPDKPHPVSTEVKEISKPKETRQIQINSSKENHFYSPLIRSIAQKEQIQQKELDRIPGTGKNKRLTKNDLFTYLENRNKNLSKTSKSEAAVLPDKPQKESGAVTADEIIPMDRMGKLIAQHMIKSVQTSAHVQSFIEIDVTEIVNWRNSVKDQFLKEKGEKLTFTPIFMYAIAQTIKEFPMVNISVVGTDIIKKKHINIGMAAALPNGNLIVPVIKNADRLTLFEMAKTVNDLALKARNGKLSPDDIQGGTYTVTNVGSFGSITGTPLINQPQVAILALGAIRKMPTVIENPEGDSIEIRQQMILAHSYDHRVVNGALGGQFILRLKEILESFDSDKKI